MRTTGTPLAKRPHSLVLPLTVKLKLSDYERLREEAAKNGLSVSSYIRQKSLTGKVHPPVIISPICQEQWRELSKLNAALSRLIFRLSCGDLSPELIPTIQKIQADMKAVRDYLIGTNASIL